ncbi:hypothetical protein Ocin01_16338 [Orchesella cincta]|uniref:Uncharacterized protein n=1 Tax=Orchesella cincta TaxID=48709 RepID=A0A1D2MBI0_ORCCI|nr:hypothetical protein Ocin01_16338 [Orchesella cincta]
MDYYDEYGPAMMLPHTRYDDLEHLKAELEQEKRYREGIEWSNSEMERSIGELETYLRDLDDSTREGKFYMKGSINILMFFYVLVLARFEIRKNYVKFHNS